MCSMACRYILRIVFINKATVAKQTGPKELHSTVKRAGSGVDIFVRVFYGVGLVVSAVLNCTASLMTNGHICYGFSQSSVS